MTPVTGGIEYGIRPAAFRLPDAARVGGVTLQVGDLARSLAYYTGVLGFAVVRRVASAAVLSAHGDEAPLVVLHERPGARPVPRRGLLGLYHFAILLPDRGALGRFAAHLASAGVPVGAADHLVSEAIYLTDPDGLGIEVYADRPRAAWRVSGRELVMATEALDLPDLVRAGGDAPWTGLPAGTTIGHVHLHVGDLREAEGFYHSALGFDKVVWSYPGALFLSAGGYHHHLGTNVWAAGARPATDDDARLLEWRLALPTGRDVEEAARHVGGRGYAVGADGADRLLTDPWGTTVRLTSKE